MLSRAFYKSSAVSVAKKLLGKILVHQTQDGLTSGIIVEVEAYLGENDNASHAAKGMTPRNKIMFGKPGFSYVYLNYGIHSLFNVVTNPEGKAGAVLIRAVEPLDGLDAMMERRKTTSRANLCSGPGKLTQALGIDLSNNGFDLLCNPLYITNGLNNQFQIRSSPRIGISKGTEHPWRFFVDGNKYISKG